MNLDNPLAKEAGRRLRDPPEPRVRPQKPVGSRNTWSPHTGTSETGVVSPGQAHPAQRGLSTWQGRLSSSTPRGLHKPPDSAPHRHLPKRQEWRRPPPEGRELPSWAALQLPKAQPSLDHPEPCRDRQRANKNRALVQEGRGAGVSPAPKTTTKRTGNRSQNLRDSGGQGDRVVTWPGCSGWVVLLSGLPSPPEAATCTRYVLLIGALRARGRILDF